VPLTSRTQPQQPATAASVQTRGTRSALLTAALVSTLGLGSTGQCSTEGSAERISAGGRRLRGQRVLQAQHASTRALLAGPPAQWRTPANRHEWPRHAAPPRAAARRLSPWHPGPSHPPPHVAPLLPHVAPPAYSRRLRMWPHPPPMWPSCRLADAGETAATPEYIAGGRSILSRTHTHARQCTRTHARTGGGRHALVAEDRVIVVAHKARVIVAPTPRKSERCSTWAPTNRRAAAMAATAPAAQARGLHLRAVRLRIVP
jgi:hypothetical protein